MEPILPEKLFMTKNTYKWFYTEWFSAFLISVCVLIALSFYISTASINGGDSATYKEAVDILLGATPSADFVPNRILTTFLPLKFVAFSNGIFGNVTTGWILMNLLLYFGLVVCFYKILQLLFQSDRVAFVGGLFLAGSYAMISFGLNYLMDIGGWTFYVFSFYFTIRYVFSSRRIDLIYASGLVGIGALFKEYAFLAIIPIGVVVLWQNRKNILMGFKILMLPALLSVVPLLLVYLYVYKIFDYTYLDWFGKNQVTYVYSSRIVEYIKSLGALFNMLAFPSLFGGTILLKEWKSVDERLRLVIVAGVFSVLPVFFWPAITERILFITIPVSIIIAGLFFKKYEKYFWIQITLLALYFLLNFFMDSYVLNAVNLSFFF